MTWKNTTVSICMVTLSRVITGLGREVRDLLLQTDLFGDPLNERDLDMQAGDQVSE